VYSELSGFSPANVSARPPLLSARSRQPPAPFDKPIRSVLGPSIGSPLAPESTAASFPARAQVSPRESSASDIMCLRQRSISEASE
jgi:hypothetical protein